MLVLGRLGSGLGILLPNSLQAHISVGHSSLGEVNDVVIGVAGELVADEGVAVLGSGLDLIPVELAGPDLTIADGLVALVVIGHRVDGSLGVLPDSLNIPVSLELGASGDDLAVIGANELPTDEDLAVLGGGSLVHPSRGAGEINQLDNGIVALVIEVDGVGLLGSVLPDGLKRNVGQDGGSREVDDLVVGSTRVLPADEDLAVLGSGRDGIPIEGADLIGGVADRLVALVVEGHGSVLDRGVGPDGLQVDALIRVVKRLARLDDLAIVGTRVLPTDEDLARLVHRLLVHPSSGALEVDDADDGIVALVEVLDEDGALLRGGLAVVLLPKGGEAPIALKRVLGRNNLLVGTVHSPALEGVAVLLRGVVDVLVGILVERLLVQDRVAVVVGDGELLGRGGLLLLNEVYIEIHVVVHRSLVARPGIRCFVVAKLQTTLSVEVVNLVARLRRHVTLERLSYLFLALLNRNPQ